MVIDIFSSSAAVSFDGSKLSHGGSRYHSWLYSRRARSAFDTLPSASVNCPPPSFDTRFLAPATCTLYGNWKVLWSVVVSAPSASEAKRVSAAKPPYDLLLSVS